MSQKAIFIDVDDTLVRSAGAKRIPITSSVELVRDLRRQGATLYLWSTGGGEYARNAARELGIEDCFDGFLPKPHALIDDVPIEKWRLHQLHPNEASSKGAEGMLRSMS